MMMQGVHTPEKSSCCRDGQRKSGMFAQRGFASRAEDSDLEGEHQPRSLFDFNLASIPLHAPVQPKLAAGRAAGGQEGDIAEKSAGPVVQRYVKVGLYEGSFGLDHIGVGVNSEKTKGFSPKAGLGREAEKGSWVEGEVKEDHDLIDSMTIKTNPRQEARLQDALNRSESSSQKFHLYQHNCAQHGAQILNSAGLGVKSSPMPRAFFEGVKRQFEPEKEETKGKLVQGRFEADPRAAEPIRSEPNRTGMPNGLKAGIEALSGIDMSDVRVHANSDKPVKLNALAYTQGNQIYLGPGQERHLAHEAWHAVQQKQGRVRATKQMMGIGVNDDAELEGEADEMGIQATQLKPVTESSKASFLNDYSGLEGKAEVIEGRTVQLSEKQSLAPGLQETVVKSVARWGKQMGKWYTQHDSTKYFNTKDEAKKWEQQFLESQKRDQEKAWKSEANKRAWEFKDVTGRLTAHFTDGWGNLYGITSFDQLKERILNEGGEDHNHIGQDRTIELGKYGHKGEHIIKNCKIKYKVLKIIELIVGPIRDEILVREVFHCGPTDQE